MVNHDHTRIKSRGNGEISDEVDRKLFEWERDGGCDRTERRNSRMSVNLVLLANSATSNKVLDKSG